MIKVMKRYVYLVCHLQTITITIEYEYNKINEIKQTRNKKTNLKNEKKKKFCNARHNLMTFDILGMVKNNEQWMKWNKI